MNIEELVLEVSLKIRMHEPLPWGLRAELMSRLQKIVDAGGFGGQIDTGLAAAMFILGMQEPTNQYSKYSQSEFDEVHDYWELLCIKVNEALSAK